MYLFAFSLAFAGTFTAQPGDDWCDLVDQAASGDEVVLETGTHDGPCSIYTDGVTIRGDGAGISYTGTSSNVLDIYTDDVTLKNIAFGRTESDIDVVKSRGHRLTVDSCSFLKTGGISIAANSQPSTGVVVTNNTFTDLRATGIYFGCHSGNCAATDYRVTGNLIDGVTSNNVGYGMEFKLNSWGVVADNVIHDTQGPAIEIYGSENASDVTYVERNFVVDTTTDGAIEIGGGPAVVTSNIVVGGATGGIVAYDYGGRNLGQDIVVVGNTIYGELVSHVDVEATHNVALGFNGTLADDNQPCDDSCFMDAASWDFTMATPEDAEAHSDLDVDFCGNTRSAPIFGAFDGGTDGGSLAIAPKAGQICVGIVDGPDDTDADDTVVEGDASSQSDSSGCGCNSHPGTTWAFLLLWAFPLLSRRQ
jgi:hypothetical protein